MKKTGIISAIVVIGIIGIFFLLTRPTKTLPRMTPSSHPIIDLIKNNQQTSISTKLTIGSIVIDYQFTDKEWNQYIFDNLYETNKSIESVDLHFVKDNLIIYVNKKSFFSPQSQIEIQPVVNNGKLELKVVSAKLGRLPVPTSFVLREIVSQENSILAMKNQNIIFKQMPDFLQFKTVQLNSNGTAAIETGIQFSGIENVLEAAKMLLPDNVLKSFPF